MIAQPELWSLGLLTGIPGRLDAMLYPPVATEEPIYASLSLDPGAPSPLRALENALYDQPLLLCDFRRVTVVDSASRALLVPPQLALPKWRPELIAALEQTGGFEEPHIDPSMVTVMELTATNAMMAMALEPEPAHFLKRTYYNATFLHSLVPTIDVVAATTQRRTLYAAFSASDVMVIAVDGAKLLLANIFHATTTSDTAYYIMAARAKLGFSPEEPLLLWGHEERREECERLLKPLISAISLWQLPPLPYLTSRQLHNIPIDLIMLPLCV